MRFLAAETREEMEMAIGQDEVYQKAYQQLEALSMDEAARRKYEAREAWLKDEATRQYEAEQRGWARGKNDGLQEGRKAGLQEGRKAGLQEGKIKADIASAIAFLDLADDATIAMKLSLPIEIVRRLRAGEDAEGIQEELLRESLIIRA